MAASAKIKVRETGQLISGTDGTKHRDKEPEKCWGTQKVALKYVCVCVCVCVKVGVEVVPKQSENTGQRNM